MIKILDFAEVTAEEVFARSEPTADVSDIVAAIIKDVRENGDEAVIRYAAKFDGIDPAGFAIELSEDEKNEALRSLDDTDPGLTDILRKAAANIAGFCSRQLREGFATENGPGRITGQKVLPLERAGIYVPGGTAAYPSTVLMDSIPALTAGCKEIIMTTPPNADGSIEPAVIAAAVIAQETVPGAGSVRIFRTGGAQAVAALAYGTESIPAVDKIVGPGNAFVAEAKRQVFGKVAIDMIAGPSEILVVSDGKSDPDVVAADMLSQAEHDKNASAVLVTDSAELAQAVAAAIETQLRSLKREEIAVIVAHEELVLHNLVFLKFSFCMKLRLICRHRIACVRMRSPIIEYQEIFKPLLPVFHRHGDLPHCLEFPEVNKRIDQALHDIQLFVREVVLGDRDVIFLNLAIRSIFPAH